MRLFAAILFLLPLFARAETVISNETLVAFPPDAAYSGTIATRPANGSTQYLNPPIFSWSPKVNFLGTESGNGQVDPYFPFYQIVISTNADLSSPIYNRRIISNMENRYDAFTNANGSINSNVIYWAAFRIATNGTTNSVTITNTFRVHAAATNWSRGNLFDETYLAAPTHPYILFTPTNRAAAYAFYQTNDTHTWDQHLIWLNTFSNSPPGLWPSNTAAWSTNGSWANNTPAFPTNVTVNWDAFYAALEHYGMTNDPNLRPLLVNQYSNLVKWATAVHYVFNDLGNGDGPIVFQCIGYGFDWLYNDLDSVTRSNAIVLGERNSRWTMRSISWGGAGAYDGFDTTYDFPSLNQIWFALSEEGTSHNAIQFSIAIQLALSFYQHGTNSRALFDCGVNYLIARGNPFGGFAALNQGRGYSTGSYLNLVEDYVNYDRVFQEVGLYRSPFFQGWAQWTFDLIPPGWREIHGAQGDGGNQGALFVRTSSPGFGEMLALGTRNGNVVRGYQNSLIHYNPAGLGEPTIQPQLHTVWPPATPTDSPTARAYLEDGWIMSSSKALNKADAFTNALGFVLVGRPRGSEVGHSTWCDGDVELWAYGAKVTDSGAANLNAFGQLADSHNQPKFNGKGNRVQYAYGDSPVMPYYSRVLAFTNTTDFCYAATDDTISYTNKFLVDNGSNVVRCIRHVFQSKTGKYFIVYDDMATWTNSVFSVNFPILEAGLTNITSNSFRFSATNFAGQTISNHFFQVASGFAITNLTGTNVTRNPVTGVYTADTAAPLWSNHVWLTTTTAATNAHSMIVVVPQEPGKSAPTITRVDDNTVTVTYDGVTETVTFGSGNTDPATYRVATLDATDNPSGGAATGSRAFAARVVIGVKR